MGELVTVIQSARRGQTDLVVGNLLGSNLFNALVVGSVYLGLYLRFDRNLWAAIICHGVYNTIVLTLIHLGHL